MLPKCIVLLLFASFIDASDYGYPDTYRFQPCPYPKIEHGRARIKQRTRLVKFMCAPRYELVGNRYATCRSGQWDVPMPVCVRSGCDPLPVSANSVQIKEHRDAWIVTFCFPGYKLVGSSAVYCDGYKWNDTAPTCVDTSVNYNLSCDFEDTNICGWTDDDLHDFDWKRWNDRTPSSFLRTGPSYDHTYGLGGNGYYMYIESTGKSENATARLLSPVYNSSLSTNGCFRLFFHMFGRTTGGLRIYQKPNSVELFTVLDSLNRNYLLFEEWGNQGDSWFESVSQLTPLDDDFQIVIEGIRGPGYISDIAIDDVSILQGDNCTSARLHAVSPLPTSASDLLSCAGRCDVATTNSLQCECTFLCVDNNDCCPDFVYECYLKGTDAYSSSTDSLPETQKLVGETSTTTTTLRPTSAKTTTTTTTTTTTAKPTTSSTITTTTTAKPTTIKPLAKTTIKVTTPRITTRKVTTTEKVTTLEVPFRTSTKKTTDDSEINKEKVEAEINLNKMDKDLPPPKQSKSSTWKTAVITIVVLALSVSLIYIAVTARTARGRQALARLRGRTNHDSEVRYLNSANDDDL